MRGARNPREKFKSEPLSPKSGFLIADPRSEEDRPTLKRLQDSDFQNPGTQRVESEFKSLRGSGFFAALPPDRRRTLGTNLNATGIPGVLITVSVFTPRLRLRSRDLLNYQRDS